jgi:hypothetical protein
MQIVSASRAVVADWRVEHRDVMKLGVRESSDRAHRVLLNLGLINGRG